MVEAALLAGKEILFGDSEEFGFNMAVDSLKERLNADTILLATHQFWITCDIHSMIQIAREAGAFLIEDASASFGSRINDQITGTLGDAAFFSFDSTKLVNVPLKRGFLRVSDPEVVRPLPSFYRVRHRPHAATAQAPVSAHGSDSGYAGAAGFVSFI